MAEDSKQAPDPTSAAQLSGSPAQEAGSNQPVSIFHPDIATEHLLRVKIPHNEAGRKFIQDLETLLQTKNLPFYNICSQVRAVAEDGKPAPQESESGSSSYTLSLQMEQIGWPP